MRYTVAHPIHCHICTCRVRRMSHEYTVLRTLAGNSYHQSNHIHWCCQWNSSVPCTSTAPPHLRLKASATAGILPCTLHFYCTSRVCQDLLAGLTLPGHIPYSYRAPHSASRQHNRTGPGRCRFPLRTHGGTAVSRTIPRLHQNRGCTCMLPEADHTCHWHLRCR